MLGLAQVAWPETSSIPLPKGCLPEVPEVSLAQAMGTPDQMSFATPRNSSV